MCPDRQILSLYVDDELPSPWKEKFEAHLVSCIDCNVRMGNYKKLRTVMQEDFIDVPAGMESRIWEKVSAGNGVWPVFSDLKIRDIGLNSKEDTRSRSFWNRSVSLPIPAAAAAAAVLVLAAFLAVQSVRSPRSAVIPDTNAIAGLGSDANMLPMSDINDVLQYLSKEDNSNYLTIELPQTRNFSSTGDPALIKAADYSRSNTIR
ncbi:MAG: zf-HC2 domain-containing protein [Treponema sp.]|nr:zf-HC2 domain-containing protein [Treponema sp.]